MIAAFKGGERRFGPSKYAPDMCQMLALYGCFEIKQFSDVIQFSQTDHCHGTKNGNFHTKFAISRHVLTYIQLCYT